jgi:magnesium transporter
MQSQESAKMANAVNRLTILSMIFLPLTFLVGLFGLNFVTTQPELSIPIAGQDQFIMLIFISLVTSIVLAVLFRRRGWL